ncbi:hypothetical protein [Acinetobacter nosocomialis]|uniref:hypothetical protein n=1 Tax=Acinetobacter nosocomialis TaxID=106654 RepID=UPI00374F1E26
MKKIIFLSLVLGLVGINGCSKVEKESKEAILSTLKDPDSAQFQNIKGYCGVSIRLTQPYQAIL